MTYRKKTICRKLVCIYLTYTTLLPVAPITLAQQEQADSGPAFSDSEEKARTVIIDWLGGVWGLLEGGGVFVATATAAYGVYQYIQNQKLAKEARLREEWNTEYGRRLDEHKYITDLKKDKTYRRFKLFRPLEFGAKNTHMMRSSAAELIPADFRVDVNAEANSVAEAMRQKQMPDCLIDQQRKINKLLSTEQLKTKAFTAIQIGDVEGLKCLIRNVATLVNTTDDNGDTLLHFAAALGIPSIVEYLLEHGAIPNIANNQGHTPLVLSANANNFDVFRVLLNSQTFIPSAELSAIFHILSQRPDPESRDFFNSLLQRSLHRRLRLSRVPECGPAPEVGQQNSQSVGGLTVLHEAVLAGNIELARVLLSQGVIPVNEQDESGNTALHYAASLDASNGYAMVELLLTDNNEAVNIPNTLGDTPLHNVVYRRNVALLQRLLRVVGVNRNITNRQGATPLFLACRCLNDGMIRALLPGSNLIDGHGQTPLHVVSPSITDQSLLNHLLQQMQQNINTTDEDGCTALHAATVAGNEAAIALLVANGADILLPNNAQKTPWDQASQVQKNLMQANLPRP